MEELAGDDFRSALTGAQVALLVFDAAGSLIYRNPASEALLGRRCALGERAVETLGFESVPEADLFAKVLRGERAQARVQRPPSLGGALEWTASSLGAGGGALVTLRDAIDERTAEHEARKSHAEQASHRQVAFLSNAGLALHESLDLGRAEQALVKLCLPELGQAAIVVSASPSGPPEILGLGAVAPLEALEAPSWGPWPGSPPAALASCLQSGRAVLASAMTPEGLSSKEAGLEALLGTEVRFASWIAAPLARPGQTYGALLVYRAAGRASHSQADAALTEDLARRAAQAIEHARLYEKALEASRLKDDFLAVVTHELRTPLLPILGWTEILRDVRTDAKMRTQALDTIERSAKSQSRLIDDLLDTVRIETGKLKLDLKPLALADPVGDVVDSLGPTAQTRQVKLTFHATQGAPRVLGDSERLSQIAWNLVQNSLKFTPPNGEVSVRVRPCALGAELVVTDTGEGIAPDILPVVFERFRQADRAQTRRHGGVGLGLSIVKQLVELHGGRVSVTSDGLQRGATFVVQLPRAPPE